MSAATRHSLVRRLTWGAVIVVLLAFAMQALVLTLWLQPLAHQFVGGAADNARQARAALRATPAADRAAMARAMTLGSLTLRLSQPSRDDLAADRNGFAPPEFQNHAAKLAAEGIVMVLRENPGQDDAVVFHFKVDDVAWVMERHVNRPTEAVTGTLTVWLVMIALATAGALLWSVRSISRPLADLAQQLAAQQGRLKPLPEERFASRELHTVVRAFNDLVHQVSYQAQVRQQLLAGVSHDLRTPLARLRLRVETQCDDDLAGELTADLLALEHIVDQFLAYVQGDTGSPQGNARPLVDCVREVVAPYLGAVQPLQVELAPSKRPVPHLAVHRLLANLIDNALAYGRAPVRVVLLDAAGGTELQVWDRGDGMTPDEFAHAQQPFVRLGGTRPDVGHCGLGLAIATQMARQLGGSLHALQDPVRGFGMVLRLPPAAPQATPGHTA